MDKQKGLKRKLFALLLTVGVSLNSFLVYAIIPTEADFVYGIPTETDFSALTYQNYKDKLEGFTSKVFFEKSDLLGVGSNTNYLINKFVQAVFWVTKQIFSICVSIYELSQNTEVLEDYFDQAMAYAVSFYGNLTSNHLGLLAFLFVITVSYAFYMYMVKGGSFLKPIIIFVLVFSLNSMFFGKNVKGEYIIGVIRKSIDKAASDVKKELSASSDILDMNGLSLDKKDAVLDLYFKVAIWEPFRYLNADIGENEEDSNGFVLSDRQLQKLVEYKTGDESFKIDGVEIFDLAGTMKEPKVKMLKDDWGVKFSYAIASVFDVTALGLVVSSFGILEFVFVVLALVLIILSPIVLIVPLFPTFENVWLNFMKKFGAYIFISGVLTVVLLITFYYYLIVKNVVNMLVGQNVVLSAVLRFTSIILAYHKRDFIVSILTANRVSNLNNSFTRRLSYRTRSWRRRTTRNAMKHLQVAKRAGYARAGLGLAMGAGAMKLGARRLAHNPYILNAPGASRAGLYLNSLKDVGRRFSSTKHRFQGNAQRLQAEGLNGSRKNPNYKKLREASDTNIQMARDKKNQALGYKVRKHNQMTKERLQVQREQRENAMPKLGGSFREYAMKERAYKSEYAKSQKEKAQSQMLHNHLTKERLQKNRRLRKNKPLQTQGFRNYRIKENQTLSRIRKADVKRR